MRSNEHSKDRRGSWHPEGLEGAVLHLVQGDEKNGRYGSCSTTGLMLALAASWVRMLCCTCVRLRSETLVH